MMGRLLNKLTILLLSVSLSACSMFSWVGGDEEPKEQAATLADLEPAIMPDTQAVLPRVDLNTLVSTYRDVLTVTDDPAIRIQVLHRLAGLEMMRGEQNLYEQQDAAVGGQFALAISAYQELLERNPEHPSNDRLMYQLSKAYDLEGRIDESMTVLTQLVSRYPESIHYSEAQFRRAEIFFSVPDYASAEQAYAEVIAKGEQQSHYQNALYMHGWSQFKRERYRASLKSFSEVLDRNVPEDNDLAKLERGKREITLDTFKVMSIVFSYLDGAQTISEVYDHFGERHYMPLLYDNLAKLYLKQERYRDSAETYRVYIARYPQSDQSPVFYASLIDVYIAAGFVDDVLTEKENYISLYGIHSDYWLYKSEQGRDYIRPFLEKYLPELAKHYHAQAQKLSTQLAQPVGNTIVDDKKPELAASVEDSVQNRAQQPVSAATPAAKKLSRKQMTKLQEQSLAYYLKAGDYYQEFIDTFPEDDEVPEIYFLLAESRFSARVFDDAIDAYEMVAYKFPDHKRGAVAGYAAIVAYNELLSTLDPSAIKVADQPSEHETWLRKKIASQLRFAGTFQNDPRASAVLVKSAEELMALKEYAHAIEAAQQLVRKEPAADKPLRKTAWLVIGHSEFELENFPGAEMAYRETLAVLDQDDSSRVAIVDRLAASVYKQAEFAMAAGSLEFAADEFLRVASVAPGTAIGVTAQFDAANAFMESKNYARAITVLADFRRNYPDNPLSADIPAKMVVAYQSTEQWSAAADELTGIYQSSADEAIKKETLYQAAELYEKAGDKDTALLRYKSYANDYPQPFPIAMEARYKLATLYAETGQDSKRRFWLKKMIAADSAAGAQRTDRSRYLAAMSSSVFAEDSFKVFQAVRLTLPLKSSLKKKKSALNSALSAYKTLADYDVEEFTTLATFRIGEIYRQLSGDLMDSQRPGNLDELALEQYELLLEEQAFPFEEKAIDIHEANAQRSWDGSYDEWVKSSFESLKRLLPARYGKTERGGASVDEIY